MKTLIIITASLIIGFGAGYLLLPSDSSDSTGGAADEIQLYTCGMHPEIISEEPGYCPICGMKLTPKKDGGGSSDASAITIDPATIQNIGLTTEKVQSREISITVRAFGKIQFAEPLVKTVNLKTSGWVEKLHVDYTGMQVSKGQALLELYSQELVAAQREYLVALKNHDNLQLAGAKEGLNLDEMLEASVMRLENWDISDKQIKTLENEGEITRTMMIRSPVDGVVVEKMVNPGDHLKEGEKIYSIADISKVWAVAYIYEQDLPFLKLGQTANITIPNIPGEKFSGEISYIAPFLNDRGQIEIRIDVINRDMMLKPDMYTEVSIHSSSRQSKPAVPLKAVINSGTRQLVYVTEEEGSYKPRMVETGAVGDDDYVEILDGLSVGELVVTSGQFLLDSESRLSESLGGAHSQHAHGGMSTDANNDDMNMDNNGDDTNMGDSGEEHEKHGRQNDKEVEELTGIYTCPMPEHYHVLQYGEGKCEECGMELVPVEHTDNEGFYHCPMAVCETISDEEGKCPECGMFLVKYDGGEKDDK